MLAYKVDLDQECVLYGEIAYLPIDLWITKAGFSMGPRIMYLAVLNLILVSGFIFLLYKELTLTSFDESFGLVIGLPAGAINLALMSMVSYTTVSSFEAVGAILVVALLVVPPATAFLWTKKLTSLIKLTCLLGILISITGYYMAYLVDSSIAGMMVAVGGIVFLGSALFQSIKPNSVFGTSSTAKPLEI